MAFLCHLTADSPAIRAKRGDKALERIGHGKADDHPDTPSHASLALKEALDPNENSAQVSGLISTYASTHLPA